MNNTELTALQTSALWELEDALRREKLSLEQVREQDRPYTPEFWLNKCVTEYGLGNYPYVRRLYEERFRRPVPQYSEG